MIVTVIVGMMAVQDLPVGGGDMGMVDMIMLMIMGRGRGGLAVRMRTRRSLSIRVECKRIKGRRCSGGSVPVWVYDGVLGMDTGA
jgi:hypothetical protein